MKILVTSLYILFDCCCMLSKMLMAEQLSSSRIIRSSLPLCLALFRIRYRFLSKEADRFQSFSWSRSKMEPIMELDTKNCYIWKSPQLLHMLAKMKTISFFTRIWSQISMSNNRLIIFSLPSIILTCLSAPAERLERIQQDYCRTVTDLSSKHFQIQARRSVLNNQSPTYSPPVARFPTNLRTEVAKRLLEPSRKGMILGMTLEFRMVLPLLTVLEHSQWQEMAMMQSVSISRS